jgi:hypothetical protein
MVVAFVAIAALVACSKDESHATTKPSKNSTTPSTVAASTTTPGGANCSVAGAVSGPITVALDGVAAMSVVSPPAPGEPVATYRARRGDALVEVYAFEDRGAAIVRTSGGSWSGNGSSSGMYDVSPDGKSAHVEVTLEGAGDPVTVNATFSCT